MEWISNMIRAGAVGQQALNNRINRDNPAPQPAAPRPPLVAATEMGTRALERQMWPEYFDERGTPRTPYPMVDAMNSEAYPQSGPSRIEDVPRPMTTQVRARQRPSGGGAPLPPKRPLAHTAPASPEPYESVPWDGNGAIPRDVSDAQNLAALRNISRGEAGPQFQAGAGATLAGMNTAPTAYASGNAQTPPPGSGLLSFLGSGAVPVFKAADVTPDNFQGPVLPHDMTGQRVGVVEGSMAHQFQESPIGKFLSLFAGGGFG